VRIAPVAPLQEAVPPRLCGGTERVISYLTENLVQLGHDVTLSPGRVALPTVRIPIAIPLPVAAEERPVPPPLAAEERQPLGSMEKRARDPLS
jgi:hypothetical protein